MIYLKIGERGSGKSNWLINKYKENKGAIITNSNNSIRKECNIEDIYYSLLDIRTKGELLRYKHIYIDDVSSSTFYWQVMEADKEDRYFYLTDRSFEAIPYYFISYMKERYPESLI